MTQPRLRLSLILATGLIAVGVAWYAVIAPRLRPTRTVMATIPDRGQLREDAPVYYHGAEVGRVSEITARSGQDGAVLRLELQAEPAVPLTRADRVRRRQVGVGGQDVVDIIPATSAGMPLAARDTLAGDPARPPTPAEMAAKRVMDSVSSMFSRPKRQ
jgi:ABC-type transporter Mla subunit MlaD